MRNSTRRTTFVLAALVSLTMGQVVAGSALAAGGHIRFGSQSIAQAAGSRVTPFSSPSTTFGIVTVPKDGTAYTLTTNFTDDNPSPNLSATIAWGDATTSAGTVTGTAPNFSVSGTHTWADEGTDVVVVTITDASTSPSTVATDTTSFTVSEGDIQVTASALSINEGVLTNAAVLTFVDGTGAESDNPFTASVNWGDGTTEAATVTGPSAGVYSVAVPGTTHRYADEGSQTAIVTVTETGVPQSPLFTTTLPVTVGEGDVFSSPVLNLTSATEGTAIPAGTTIATFTDSYALNTAADFTATIDWGDGTTSLGTVADTAGTITVKGGHSYADEGTYTVTVVVSDDSPGTATSTATGSVAVAEGDVFGSPSLVLASPTEGVAVAANTVVATFPDTGYPGNAASDFTGTISWGDGSPVETGTVTMSSGTLSVRTAGHTYADEGTYTVSVTITDDSPGTATSTASGSLVVLEGDSLAGSLAVSQVPHVFTGTVATFTNSGYPTNPASDFTATIAWGDAITTAGTITVTGPGTFAVSGSHTYAPGVTSVTLSVTLTDDAPGTATATASGTVAVVDPPTISKAFGAPAIDLGGSTSLSFTVTNPNIGAPLAGIAFTDTLPAGLVVATPNGLAGTCGGGTITATAGSSSVSLSGATLAASASCTFSVNVTGTIAGTKDNSVTVTATVPGDGNTAHASVTVRAPDLTIAKHHVGHFVRRSSGIYTMVVTNAGAGPTLGTVTVHDVLPPGMVVISISGSGWSCLNMVYSVTCSRSDALAATASYPTITLRVSVTALTPTFVVNVASVAGGGELVTANDVGPDPTLVTPF